MTPKLPPLPRPDGPDVGQYTEESLRSSQLEAWKAAMECAAKLCHQMVEKSAVSWTLGTACAEAIRSIPLPE